MYVCICHAITDRQIQEQIANGTVRNLSDLQAQLGVATGCGCCAEAALSYLNPENQGCHSAPVCA